MKRFVVAVLVLMLIFTEVLSPVQVNAVEAGNQCEEKAFTIEPFTVGDEKLEGEGHPGEEIDLQFKDMEAVIEADEEGHFEYIWEEAVPAEGDTITLKNMPYEIELTAEAGKAEHEELEAKLVDTCEPAVPAEEVEGTEAEGSVEEEAMEEDSDASIEEGEKEGAEKSAEETSLDEESEEAPAEESTEESEMIEEPVVEESDEAVPEEDGPAEEEVSSEEPIEEEEEELESEEAAPNGKEPDVEEKEEVKSEGDADKETDVAKEEVADKHERTEEAESTEEASEESVESGDRMARSSMATVQEVSSVSAVPIEEVQGQIKDVFTYSEFINALENENIEKIFINSNLNKVDGYSSSNIEVDSTSGQKIIEGNGHAIDSGNDTLLIEDRVMNMVIMNADIFSNNRVQNQGFIRKKDDHMSLRLENINFNKEQNDSLGMLGSSWESDVHFYGENEINTGSHYGMAFQNVVIHEGATFNMNHDGNGGALKFDRNVDLSFSTTYGLEIMEEASVHILSNESVFQTDLTKFYSRDLQTSIGKGSIVVFKGRGTFLFDLDTRMDFQIDQPRVVDFHNQNSYGSIFSRRAFFSVTEVVRKNWVKGNMSDVPSKESGIITSEQFTLSINSNLRRMKLDKVIHPIEVLDIPEIKDTDFLISGITAPGSEVTISSDSNNFITSTQAGNDGEFTFNLDERFDTGTVLRFNATLDNAASETVEKTVIGNRLEFGHVSTSIPFNTTEIKDEEMKIYRQNDNPGIEIVETMEGKGWKLSVEATSSLTNENQDTLENALYYFSDGSTPESIERGPVTVARGMTSETIEWGRDEGILLKLNPIRAAADTEYEATIEWTLSDGP